MTAPPASSERPLPLVARKDLHVRIAEYCGEKYRVIKDPVRLEYYRLSREQHAVFELLDGQRSLDAIYAALVQKFPARRLTLSHIRQLVFDLYENGLAWSTRPGQADTLLDRNARRKKKLWLSALRSLFFIRIPGWDPHRLIECVYPAVRWMFHPWTVAAVLASIVGAGALVLIHFAEIHSRMLGVGQLTSWHMVCCAWVALGVAKVLHELGHALACRHFGGECHEIGLAFLIFSPCLYCDVSDSWLLPSKWKRIAVAAAGMYVEMVLSAIALFVWWNTRPGLVHDLAFATLLVTSLSTILFNVNPLLRLDGYYMLSDWLEIPNLRRRADQALERKFTKWCLGVRPLTSCPDNASAPIGRTGWFVIYSLASFVYRWLVCFAICLLLYQLLRPVGLAHLGLLIGIASAVAAIAAAVWRVWQLFALHWDQLTSFARPAATLGVLAGLLLAALFVPLPVHVEAALALQPHNVQHVYVMTPGRIEAVHVRPGQPIRRGDVLVRLANFRREDHLRQLQLALASQEIEVKVQQALGDAAQAALASKTLQAMREEAAEFERQLAKLTIVAPCDGVVVSPIGTRERTPGQRKWTKLPVWHGSPLDLQNRGSFLEAGTHLLSIAPEDRYEAILHIDEPDRNDFEVGQDVKIKMQHLPGAALRSKIHRLTRHARGPEQRISNESAPTSRAASVASFVHPVHTVPRVHEAAALLPPDATPLIPGMAGEARILVTHRSAAGWLWRYVCSTFKFLG